ncbi:MAG: P13 family porin, partial [Spirochaetaceae bacterium]|nr:P13 family porin [Spirochaetaceae bacterium]
MANKYLIALVVFLTFSVDHGFSQTYGINSFGIYDLNNSFEVSNFQKGNAFDNTINPRFNISSLAVSQIGAFLINGFVGLGIGSYAQGDIVGGTIGLIGEVGGFGLMVGGFAMSASNNYQIDGAA